MEFIAAKKRPAGPLAKEFGDPIRVIWDPVKRIPSDQGRLQETTWLSVNLVHIRQNWPITPFPTARFFESCVKSLSTNHKEKEPLNQQTDDPQDLRHYQFELPKELIAQFPLPNRVDSRLMLVDRAAKSIGHHHVRDLSELLGEGDLLVMNDTRVFPAKLVGYRTRTGGRWQGLFLETDSQEGWRVLCKTRGRIQPGETVTLQDRNNIDRMKLVMLAKLGGGQWAVRPETDLPAFEILQELGRIPLPHYIRDGNMVDDDIQNYQTVFAKHSGSIAAPTAGLHFTEQLLNRLIDRGVQIAPVTLHVGLGTFRPIGTQDIREHQMHAEWGQVPEATAKRINSVRAEGGRVIAVGTTTTRLLESAASASPNAAGRHEVVSFAGETSIFIKPPYRFRSIDGLMTNFHLPGSTLIVMVRTFGGDAMIQRAYQEAISEKYRFFSYGDAMLIV